MDFKNKKEIAAYFTENRYSRKHTDTEFYTLLHQSISRLMQGQKLPIYNVSNQLCDCNNFEVVDNVFACKECGKKQKSISA